MINSRSLVDLNPKVADLCRQFIEHCAAAGIDVLITSTYRDNESQDALYALGRTQAGARVTNARGGQSWHNYGVAFDFVPIVHGKAVYSDTRAFERCGVIAESIGLEWAGRWTGFKEMAHCQYTGGLTLSDLASGKAPQ
jgi:peptidoglycan L-alanyl-D-glutamate endopeptidase CwlK